MNKADSELGVYVHWPYCARICPYCDFNVFKNRKVDEKSWIDAFGKELEHWAEITGPRNLTSIYFGGGTPSLAPPDVINAVIEKCKALWGHSDNIEITLESNPTDVERDRFSKFHDAGVNRLSLGIQSLNDEALKFLGRDHNASEGMKALDVAQSTFENVSIDLIYALPEQTLDQWRNELQTAMGAGVGHLSLYQLTIEEGTAFAKAVKQGRWTPTASDNAADMFELTQQVTAAVGLPAYEISNHATPGQESKHNQIYWRYADYVGIGPGAHGRISVDGRKFASETIRYPAAYLSSVIERGNGAEEFYALSREDELYERFAMGLRTNAGITLYADDIFYEDEERVVRLNSLVNDGYLANNCGRLTATDQGLRILDTIIFEVFR
ncbi:MAG: radical SAM family heme chaperone HemW [Marinicaulis sp.]|nr:radical SAM family heme chaperone HemW [Marinicaulis sp.]